MKIFISADIEGCTGIASFSQCGAASRCHFDYPFARRMMTDDLNAVLDGAKEAGATSFVIKDGHGNGKNLLADELRPGATLISGQGGTSDGMMDGIDDSFDAAILFGYHAMSGASRAFMEHALVGGLRRFWINGSLAGEIMTNAAVAGAYGVPTILVTSDEAGAEEAAACLPGVETATTKRGFGKSMGSLDSRSETLTELQAAGYRSVSELASKPVFGIGGMVEMRAEFRTSEEAEMVAILPDLRRLDSYTLAWTARDFQAAHRIALSVFQLSIRGRATLK
jgi:D-amino peptidase